MKKRILLLSAYCSDSHASWVNWLVNNLDADWQVLELPGRYFRWRIRGNPLSWLDQLALLLKDWQPQKILATSMVDIATIKGLYPSLASVPVSYYFHENQFAYPRAEGQHDSVDPQMVQLYGALAAQECLFNSDFNRRTFLAGVDALLKQLPDCKPAGLAERLAEKCRLLSVPVKTVAGGEKIPGLILWNHRWEYDKKPELFLQLLHILKEKDVNISVALLGARAEKIPPVLGAIRKEFPHLIVADGMVGRGEYEYWLGQSEFVVSTAIHEFQGLSVQEAVSAGALPVVPDALCYREQYADEYRYPAGDMSAAADIIRQFRGNYCASDSGQRQPAVLFADGWYDWLKQS
ncbi:MAG: glycosyl transferase family 1 [Oceanospirillaceae bacterium]|nr:glycosyl transferase family 1 [Oceanospirillaceae bacterium]MBT13097.1 glycosyl transferase family 1 [Oceanospirillaceae bacterium]|tara:strand:+ start:3356 stop:4402 length:1047 start_codon:yes stop_codon:yes gene_type:complete